MIFGFAVSYAQEGSEKPEDATKKTEIKTVSDNVEEASEDPYANLRTKEEIAAYLNSLPERKIMELHYIRDEILEYYQEWTAIGGIIAAGAFFGGAGLLALSDAEGVQVRKPFLRVGAVALGAVAAAGLGIAFINGTRGAWGGDDYPARRRRFKAFVEALTLEEAREVLEDVKNIRILDKEE